YMGADPIVFIGQDLAFTGGKDHAEGTMYDKRKPNLKKKRKIQVKGNVEEYVYTDDTFKTYLDWFQDAIASDQTDRRYINATEGGAYIEGTEVMTLQSAIEKYCKTAYSISDKIQEIFTKSPVFIQEEIEHIVKEQRKAYNEFSEIKDKLRRSIDCSEKIKEMYEIGRIDEKNHRYLLKQLDHNDEWLKKQQQNFNLLDYILQKSIRESYMILYRQEQPNETPEEQGLRIMKGNIALYQGMLDAIEEMEPVLDEYFETMKKEGYIDE
ncbi:MAG: motility associated factor glycosyltransferase family protein, partial [Epulopiscium sp.]|nr:motility associated factor glycosyltransferase family protein [Candidatus Epulonipiscium sp.]